MNKNKSNKKVISFFLKTGVPYKLRCKRCAPILKKIMENEKMGSNEKMKKNGVKSALDSPYEKA